jgi:hypothetical protein
VTVGISGSSSSSPSSSARPIVLPPTDRLGCESCGRPTSDLYWRTGHRSGLRGLVIERVCRECAGESFEDTTGASGLRGSVDASPAATTPRATHTRAPQAHINFLTPRGAPPLAWRSLLDGRAPIWLPDRFKTLLQGVSTSAADWFLGLQAAVVGRRDGRRL